MAFNGNTESNISNRGLFALSYALAFIGSKYLGFSAGYALDDYKVSHPTAEGLSSFFLSQGRYTNAALDVLLRMSDLNMTNFSVIAIVATLVLSMKFYSSVLISTSSARPESIVATAALLGAHSYYTEYVTFRQSALPMAVMFGMLWLLVQQYRLAVFEQNKTLPRLLAATAAGIIAMGANQLALCFATIGILYMHMTRIMHTDANPLAQESLLQPIAKSFLHTALAGLTLTIGNLFTAKIGRAIVSVPADGRASLIAIEHIPERLTKLSQLMATVLVESEPVASSTAKILLLLAIFFALIPACSRQRRASAVAVLFAAAASAIAFLPHAMSSTWWPVPRTLISVPLVFSGILIVTANELTNRWKSGIISGLTLTSALLFCAHSNAILTNQQRVNRWDIAQAQAITTYVTGKYPDHQRRIAIVGGRWAYDIAPSAAQGDMNISAFSVAWAIDPMFDEATGINMDVRTAPEFIEVCATKPSFPSTDSTIPLEAEIIVCL